MSKEDFEALFIKFLGETMTDKEIDRFRQLFDDEAYRSRRDELLEMAFTNKAFVETGDYDAKEIFAELQAKIEQRDGSTPVIPLHHHWRRIAGVAAVLTLLLTGSLYWYRTRKPAVIPSIVNNQARFDAPPGHPGAILTLADGKQIRLDSTQNGSLQVQGGTHLLKQGAQLKYSPGAGGINTVFYNTMTTPRGMQYQLVLSDGTKVWLNAASAITYPASFTGRQRKVTLTGEAYFEVKDDPARPFIVNKGDMTVEVLGTHFDVNAYDDEESTRVTLLQGAVKVNKGNEGKILKPGQQAQVQHTVQVSNDVNTEEVMAWKDGVFYFNRTPLPAVLRQLSRWYDVDVVYQAAVPDLPFGGEMGKDLSLSQILTILSKVGVKFRIEGKKLIVLP